MKSDFADWSDIRVFLAVCREGSTLAASRRLGIAQPTVARRIGALEQALGLVLFDRDTQGFRATQAAKELLPLAERLEAEAGALAREARRLAGATRKAIRITGAPETFSENFAAIVSDFTADNPGVTFEFYPTAAVVDLSAGEADVAIRYSARIEDESLVCRKVSTATSALYASQGYIAKFGKPAGEDDFSGHRFVVVDAKPLRPVIAWLMERIAPEQIVMTCTDFNGLISAVQGGFGMGFIGTGIGDGLPGLERCIDPPEGFEVTTWLLASAAAYRRSDVKAFMAYFAPRYSAMLKRQRAERAAARRAGRPPESPSAP